MASVSKSGEILKSPLKFDPRPDSLLLISQIAVPSPTRADMIPSFHERAKRWVAGAFCVLLTVGGIAPSTARAGCGHGVTSNLSRSVQESLSSLEGFGHFTVEQNDSTPASPRRDRPCSGLSCSQGRRMPQVPAASSTSLRSDPWCCTTIVSCWDSPDLAESLPNPFLSCPRHNTSPPERPPRNAQPRTHS